MKDLTTLQLTNLAASSGDKFHDRPSQIQDWSKFVSTLARNAGCSYAEALNQSAKCPPWMPHAININHR